MLDLFENQDPDELVLRPLQEYVVNQARDALRQHRRIVIQCATGFGKTILATYFFQQAHSRGKKCLF
jgi:superfamily II DNA or RNA helicase